MRVSMENTQKKIINCKSNGKYYKPTSINIVPLYPFVQSYGKKTRPIKPLVFSAALIKQCFRKIIWYLNDEVRILLD